MLLKGKPVVKHLNSETKQYIEDNNLQGSIVTFFLLNDDKASSVYVRLKMKQAERLGLKGEMITEVAGPEALIAMIEERNQNDENIGMIVQLPLPQHLQEHQAAILSAIEPRKDVDGLGGKLFGLSSIDLIEFLPATPKAVIEMLKFYGYGDLKGKTVMILGQSNLVGKPLALDCMKRGATVMSFNASSDQSLVKNAFSVADIVISATGVVHLVGQKFLETCTDCSNKVMIDVGRGIKDGQAVGDMDVPLLEPQVAAITPVPGGIGPVTVACIFHNIKIIGEQQL